MTAMDLLIQALREALNLLFGGDREVWQVVSLTMQVSLTATTISVVIGVAFSLGLALCRFPGRGFVVSAINTGMGFPPVAAGLLVTLLLWRSGPLGSLGLLYTPTAMIIAQTVIALPLVTGISLAALQQLPPDLARQLKALGATRWQTIRGLLLEARLPLLAAVMAGFGAVVSEVGSAMMVGGNIRGQTRVLTTAMVMETSKGNFDLALALGLVLLILAFTVTAVLTGVQQRGRKP